jgi:hypothetical protein
LRLTALVVLFTSTVFSQSSFDPAQVLTYHNDNARSGTNSNETRLTPVTVGSAKFGPLFVLPVDGAVYAQPLYMQGLKINGKVHNVVFAATENNSIFAFDADTLGPPLWHANFNYGASGATVTPASSVDVNCTDLQPIIGVTGTPVIDASAGILYAVAKTKEVSGASTRFYYRIHGVNVLTGKEAIAPITVTASVPGRCGNVHNGNVIFDPLVQAQRPALLLLNQILYIGSASYCDLGSYNGWLLGYDVRSGKQTSVFNTTADDATGTCDGGIWQSGGGPAADASDNIYLLTGNGAFNADQGGHSYGNSALKLSTDSTGAISVADYFTPSDVQNLTDQDLDFAGSGASVLLPDQPGPNPHLLVAAGKLGTIYLINRDQMGKFNAAQEDVVQKIPQVIGDGVSSYPPPVYFNGALYYSASNDSIKAFKLSNGQLSSTPFAASKLKFGYLGAGLSLSSGGDATSAVLWALEGISGTLHAFDANLNELYNSDVKTTGANLPGYAVKFAIPTVANGKVFTATQNTVVVYGLFTSSPGRVANPK